jgi:hypothetical protein
MVVMAVVSLVPVLADLFQATPVVAISNLALGGMSLFAILLLILAALPIFLMIASIPLWIAAKMAVSSHSTYLTALKVVVCNFLAGILIRVVVMLMAMVGGLMGTASGRNTVDTVALLISLLVTIFIIANCYEIGVLHAFGVNVLWLVVSVFVGLLAVLVVVAVIGVAGAQGHLRESLDKFNQTRNSITFPSSRPSASPPSPSPSWPPSGQSVPASQPDYSAEIDGLLNAAMHPTGPKPSLSEREDIVRTLQQRLQAQRANIFAGDTQAINVYQNQYNRYMLLLNQVKAERKAHPSGESTAIPQAAR